MDSTKAATRSYAKRLTPLESNPLVLNDLMYHLGVSRSLTLTDVWSIDNPEQLNYISRPVFAFILVLPTSNEYEKHRRVEMTQVSKREGEEVIWIQQTIDNACGLYAILHAACNFETR